MLFPVAPLQLLLDIIRNIGRYKWPIKKIWTNEFFSELKQGYVNSTKSVLEADREGIVTSIPDNSGLAHTHVERPVTNYIAASNQVSVNTDNAAIVLGTDRPSTIASGKGAIGAQNAATIDLVTGRMSSARKGDGVEDGTFVNPSFSTDAARIYISQLTDVDLNFGLADGNLGSVTGPICHCSQSRWSPYYRAKWD